MPEGDIVATEPAVAGSAHVLTITVSNTAVVLTWPATTDSYVLESTPSLAPPVVWTPVTPRPQSHRYEVPSASGARFYRLRQSEVK
jgi:hypothetical protein